MNDKERLTYRGAGVDTKEGEKAVALIKPFVSGIGSFGGFYKPDLSGMKEPVLVSGTDGVGTKLKIAFLTDKHDTIGIDCVAMCVNDILCQGAKPLFFLDYIATGRIKAEKIARIVKGVAEGCAAAGCELIGGETAEHPGMMPEDEYDIAGFAVGIADRQKIITGEKIREGDRIIGLSSSGLHSNGFSLVRRLFFEKLKRDVDDHMDEFEATLGEVLLTPTRIYAKACSAVFAEHEINGVVHITGGGFYENIPRVLPVGLGAKIAASSWERPRIFSYIREHGNMDENEMFSTFNMGVGMMMFTSPETAKSVVETLRMAGETADLIGEVVKGEGVVIE